jgi:hypothetical protein
MAPLTFTQNCAHGCGGFGNSIVDVPPATGHIGNLVIKTLSQTGTRVVSSYQPANRFWEFQSIEAGIFVALTLAVLGAAVFLIHRRGT